jgi:hypothetical protein
MATNPVQSAAYRVHIENLAFNVNKRALTLFLVQTCRLQHEPDVQMIRKDSGKYTGLCSCIFAVRTKDIMLQCIELLGQVQYNHMAHLLGQGKFTLNAKEAYYPGAKRLNRSFSASTYSEDAVVNCSVSFSSI